MIPCGGHLLSDTVTDFLTPKPSYWLDDLRYQDSRAGRDSSKQAWQARSCLAGLNEPAGLEMSQTLRGDVLTKLSFPARLQNSKLCRPSFDLYAVRAALQFILQHHLPDA